MAQRTDSSSACIFDMAGPQRTSSELIEAIGRSVYLRVTMISVHPVNGYYLFLDFPESSNCGSVKEHRRMFFAALHVIEILGGDDGT